MLTMRRTQTINHHNNAKTNAMEKLTFGACVKKSWGSAWQAIITMPGLFLCVCVVYACTTILSGSFHSTRAGHSLAAAAGSLVQFVAGGLLTIKVHRFVLLGERSQPLIPLGGKPLGRYVVFSFGVALAMLVVMVPLALTLRRPILFVVVLLPLLVVWMFAMVRLSLLFPAIALGSPLTLRAPWRDSRGHFWSMVGVWFVAYIPLMVLWIIALVVLGPKTFETTMQGFTAFGIGFAVVNTVFLVLAATSLSWLYRRYANALLEQVAH